MVVARSFVYRLWVFGALNANGGTFKILSSRRNELRVLYASIEVVHEFEAALGRNLVAQLSKHVCGIGVTQSVARRDVLSIAVNAASGASKASANKVINGRQLSIELLVEAVSLSFAAAEEIVCGASNRCLARDVLVGGVCFGDDVDESADSSVAIECR